MELTETQIKTALKEAGLKEELAKDMKVETEEQLKEKIKELSNTADNFAQKAGLTGDDFEAQMKKAGLYGSFSKYLQSETDRRVTEAIKTHDEKIAKAKKDEEDKVAKEKERANLPEKDKEIAELRDTVKNLSEKIDSLSGSLTTKSLSEIKKAALKEAGLSESFVDNISGDTEEKIKENINTFKEAFEEKKQTEIDKALKDAGFQPQKGTPNKSIKEQEITDYAKEKNEGGTDATFKGRISSQKESEAK